VSSSRAAATAVAVQTTSHLIQGKSRSAAAALSLSLSVVVADFATPIAAIPWTDSRIYRYLCNAVLILVPARELECGFLH
jgi:hypothetical protein